MRALIRHVLSRSVFQPLADRSPNAIVVTTLGVSLVLMEAGRIAADTHDFWLPPMLAAADRLRSGRRLPGDADAHPARQLRGRGRRRSRWPPAALARSSFGRAGAPSPTIPAAAAHVRRRRARACSGTRCCSAASAPRWPASWPALYYGNVSFGAGLVYGLKILFVTAVGGYLSPPRAALGAAAFGIAESLWSGYFPVEWRDAWMFCSWSRMLVLIGRPAATQAEDRLSPPITTLVACAGAGRTRIRAPPLRDGGWLHSSVLTAPFHADGIPLGHAACTDKRGTGDARAYQGGMHGRAARSVQRH